jgi:hypothetical protein
MKRNIIIGAVIIVIGLLISLGTQYIFMPCPPHGNTYALCHWTTQAELGMGMLIAAFGLCFIVFPDTKTQIGLTLGIFFTSIMVIGLPYALIGGCTDHSMRCHKVTFPVVTVLGSILLLYSIFVIVLNEIKSSKESV